MPQVKGPGMQSIGKGHWPSVTQPTLLLQRMVGKGAPPVTARSMAPLLWPGQLALVTLACKFSTGSTVTVVVALALQLLPSVKLYVSVCVPALGLKV